MQDQGSKPKSDPMWYVVQTKRHREAMARVKLEIAGLTTYLPRTLQWPPPAVGSEVGPLFPTYVFVRLSLPEDYYRVIWQPGVKDFVSFGESPAVVPDSAIEFLKSREDDDGLIRCGDDQRDVQIVRGPLKGLSAVIERRLTKRQRVVVLMELLQHEARVEVPEQWVKLA